MEKCETSCVNEHRILSLEEDIKRNQHTHKEFYDRFEKINGEMVGYEHDMSYLKTTLGQVSVDVKEIKEKPTKRWDTAVASGITAIIGGIIGFLINTLL